MSHTDGSRSAFCTPVMIVPLLLALGGCMVAPIATLATSGAGNAGMASAITQFIPGMASGRPAPCTPGTAPATPGCNAGTPQQAAAPDQAAATTDAVQSPCRQNNAATPGTGCDTNVMDAVVQGLTASLQKLAPGQSASH